MHTIPSLMIAFESYIPFAASLRQLSDDEWVTPLAPGKWSTREIMAHMMLWDRHFMNEAIAPIAEGKPLTYKQSDFNLFNGNAAAYSKTISREELINGCIAVREELVTLLKSLNDAQKEEEYRDGNGNPFTILFYLEDFVEHDAHHRGQIVQFFGLK
ncbi:putative damage-inducible protein DinB [Paenibacillus taihuensis]|uniref:Putative damage-inducible protein DinB n=1 Tax=Paenibacillus taihuensis TaxID=1156355 RepID=A0A3D9SJ92_9BACL|nr:DinB family protein [Paenibacillus taihuensis]REE94400.1 putative damage-inducible protein DinB [Paenibacillus taihuensis]